MDIENLVKMANQIGQFFEAEPDRKQAEQDIASHIKRFWDPRMRKAIVAYSEESGTELNEIVNAAIKEHRGLLV
ncbi:formate dehydrogenase subunit delta [Novimethylophilus kurashikiensis]|uniref:Formate dehydrogenase subunit delta n=1 Tax=Novimethylophilus kurashikiensis TaxID=1825523 RepID=A0A2R5FBV3_9PROT|nr:formate dehydrogenase subunit delta [Novimethylophilus kurashikiensis]GBG15319.1 formate dehydrogenase subunit delta [Novimethylophilus kurashikiensis]